MNIKSIGLFAAIAIAGFTVEGMGTASAAVVDITYTGTVSAGSQSGLFGAPGDLTGAGFVLEFRYDTSVPGIVSSSVAGMFCLAMALNCQPVMVVTYAASQITDAMAIR